MGWQVCAVAPNFQVFFGQLMSKVGGVSYMQVHLLIIRGNLR